MTAHREEAARPEAARPEAARWFATLRRGVMTVDEQADYKAWLRNRGNEAALEELRALWGELEGVRPRVAPKSQPAARHATRGSRFGHALQAAVVIGTVLVGVGIMYSTDTSNWTTLDWSDR